MCDSVNILRGKYFKVKKYMLLNFVDLQMLPTIYGGLSISGLKFLPKSAKNFPLKILKFRI